MLENCETSFPYFPKDTRRVNFYRRSKTQRAKNCITIFFPRAIFKLLERECDFHLVIRCGICSCSRRDGNAGHLTHPFGDKISRIPFRIVLVPARFIWNGLFFIRNISQRKVSSQRVCRPFPIPLSRDAPCERSQTKEGLQVPNTADNCLPLSGGRPFMSVVNVRRVERATSYPRSNRKKGSKEKVPGRRSEIPDHYNAP